MILLNYIALGLSKLVTLILLYNTCSSLGGYYLHFLRFNCDVGRQRFGLRACLRMMSLLLLLRSLICSSIKRICLLNSFSLSLILSLSLGSYENSIGVCIRRESLDLSSSSFSHSVLIVLLAEHTLMMDKYLGRKALQDPLMMKSF